ncbi:MAG TPA: lipase, partial [Candidatus Dormibacteraeota bacterium]
MRRVPTVLAALAVCSALLQPGPARAAVGPTLSVSESTLASSLKCPATYKGAHNPLLLVHGTAGTPDATWSWNYVKTLSGMGYDVCTVALSDFARADIQVSAEHVVYAIRTMAADSHRKVDVMGFSQGPLEPRWAVKYWPDVQ